MVVRILEGHVLDVLATLPDNSVDLCVCSPPYYGLRAYGTEPQVWTPTISVGGIDFDGGCTSWGPDPGDSNHEWEGAFCARCGAWKGELGQEPTPELYVAHLVDVFRALRPVLKPTGVLLLNLGDTYWNDPGGQNGGANNTLDYHANRVSRKVMEANRQAGRQARIGRGHPVLKRKDLVGIPWSVAKALQAPYYAGRIKNERDRAWLAALLDGEGTICGFHHVRSDGCGVRTGAHIFITNSSSRLLDEAQRIWPASRSEHMRAGAGHLGLLGVDRWIVHGTENKLLFLREIYPYLIAKREQSVLAYNLLLLMADAKKLGRSSQRDAVRERRARLVHLMSEANHGKAEVPSWCVEPPTVLEPGWYLRGEYVWHKPNALPESVGDRCTKAHEHVFHLTKRPDYFWDAEAIAEPAAWERWGDQTVAKVKPGEVRGSFIRAQTKEEIRERFGGTKNKRSVWTIPTESFAGAHFAVMPEALVKLCIEAGSPKGGTVLDPFGGSGTVGVVADRLGRDAVLIDLNGAYVAMAERRIRDDSPLFAEVETASPNGVHQRGLFDEVGAPAVGEGVEAAG